MLFCENETNMARLYGARPETPYPKDGIDDHVIHGAATVNPEGRGTKCAFWYKVEVPPGGTAELRLRLRPRRTGSTAAAAFGRNFGQVIAARRGEADEFYTELTPEGASEDEALVMRQAFSGMLWSKQLYYYDVARWLDGDPAQPPPPAARRYGRNARWRNFNSFDIMSMPDKWEYPWFAAWDLAFHSVALAHVDPAFAKYQLILLCREWFQHPNGALPAYEWDFADVNPPVQAWAALEVFAIDGGRDLDFLSRIFDKLLVNFTWWVNREDAEGNNLFEGGFLGLDNIGPIDRSHLPVGGELEQSDATGWMAFYAIAMAGIAAVLHRSGHRPSNDIVLEVPGALRRHRDAIDGQGLWDEADGLYYDRLLTPGGRGPGQGPVHGRGHPDAGGRRHRASTCWSTRSAVSKQFADYLGRHGAHDREKLRESACAGRTGRPAAAAERGRRRPAGEAVHQAVRRERVPVPVRAARAVGLPPRPSVRARTWKASAPPSTTSRPSRPRPCSAATPTGGGRCGSRSTTWSSAPQRYHRFFGDDLTVEYPTGSGRRLALDAIAADLQDRLISIFLPARTAGGPASAGRAAADRPGLEGQPGVQRVLPRRQRRPGSAPPTRPAGPGVIADVIRRRHGAVRAIGDVVQDLPEWGRQ